LNVLLDLSARPVIAHRGGSALAPENTLEAFRAGVAQGAEALEVDVRATADGEAVVIHDATVDRTTDRAGPVVALSLAELRDVDAGHRFSADGGRTFPYRGRSVRVPTLESVVTEFPDLPLLVHLKTPAAQERVRDVLTRCGAIARSVVASELDEALRVFRASRVAVGATARDTLDFFTRAAIGLAPRQVPFRAFAVPERFRGLAVPTRRFVAAARRAGCPTHVWTVNDAAAATRLWAIGVAGIVTDLPGVIRQARAHGVP
jgi:glycerophosphoryl diester phosphodiesterase